MKGLKTKMIIVLAMMAGLITACSGDKGAEGRGQAALSITFPATTQKAAAAASLQELGITELILNVIPAHPTSFATGTIDLLNDYNKTGSNSHTINGLADNETYVFMIQASGPSTVYGGLAHAVIAPVGTTPVSITLQEEKIDAPFPSLAFQASVSDLSEISFVEDGLSLIGTYTRNAPTGAVSGSFFIMPTSRLNMIDLFFLAPGTGTSLAESGSGIIDLTPLKSSQPPKTAGTLDTQGGQHLTFRSL